MGVRIKDIAKMLDISPATVSLVLNNRPGIGEDTRQKVLKLAEEMGYSFSPLSRSGPKNNRSIRFVIYKKHGQVVSDTPFFSTLMEGIEQEARDRGYDLIISYVNEVQNTKTEVLRLLEDSLPEGILLLGTEMQVEDLQPFNRMGIPLVVLDSSFSMEKVDTVVIQNEGGAFKAVKHLIHCGHSEIGHLRSSVWIKNFEQRKDGFAKALAEHGMKQNKKYVYELESTMDGAYRDMYRALASKPVLPTAFFADNDIIAFGAIRALKEYGYKIPEEISIIGFDDMPFCEMTEPPLTTVKVYNRRMGRIAVQRLLDKIRDNAEEFVRIEVGTELIERKSVSCRNA